MPEPFEQFTQNNLQGNGGEKPSLNAAESYLINNPSLAKNKPLIILSGITVVLAIVLTLSLLFTSPSNNNQTRIPQSSPEASPALSEQPLLFIFNFNPPLNPTQTYFPITEIEITFSDLVSPERFSYTVNPNVQTNVRLKPGTNTLVISPETEWTEGRNTITIQATTQSIDGKRLDKEYTYIINAKYPENPPFPVD